MQSVPVALRNDVISVTLKFGFQQNPLEYSINSASIERLYNDAETWLRKIANNTKSGQPLVGCYTIYLFRISPPEFTMVPIVQSSDIEQNSFIEVVLIPIEINQTPHSLYRCQLNVPTNCSKCSRFIAGLYRQGFRCRKCRMTYHKDCAPFLLDDCTITNGDLTPTKKSTFNLSQLTFVKPFINDPIIPSDRTVTPRSTSVPFYSTSTRTIRESAPITGPTTILDKGIFPACIRGAPFHRRYLFRLTMNTLSMATNLSASNVAQTQLPQSGDIDTIFPLTEIADLILTHFMDDRDDIFEIHLRHKTVISVGKKTDSDELQMETAQFYSSIRELRETLINAAASPSSAPSSPSASTVHETKTPGPTTSQGSLPPLKGRISIAKKIFGNNENGDKDLHEVYAFTGEKIGEGAFGRVMGAYKKATRQEVAVKIVEKINCNEKDVQRINEEIENLYKFNHVNILKLEAFYERDDAVYLITERMETDMCKYITSSKNGYLDEDTCKMLIFQVIVALRHLHENNYGHLDVKCENILISLLKPKPDDAGKTRKGENPNRDFPLVKLADFGYSRIIGEHSFRKTRVGTRVYNAPEIYRSEEGYNRLADMWSAGIVLYAALSGTLPYDEKGSHRAEEIVRDKNTFFSGPQWTHVSKEATDLISNKLLVVRANSRIRPNDALFHDWFTDFSLFKNLREIERRTRYLFQSKKQELPSGTTWLTGEREDPVWTEYRILYANPKD